ncbi:MAG: pyridoxal-phosphate dependent enzyme [Candidatus Heimdallarchaeota archaeon]|nr:pyridoxal-phosphate dependent enzyme [Candidatus Heimdallarchaeota archaeon]MCK4768980.1 pyridoxal-phosphate dependent enzyme [Candidatus Heimdallarchaeota archaeon]
MIDLTKNDDGMKEAVKRAQERNIIIPTFAQQRNPSLIPTQISEELTQIGLWDVHPRNLFRITWKNEPKSKGGIFGDVNYIELPSELTGVEARIIGLVGKYFPTGAHKVGASFGCLVPRLITGQFNPSVHKAVWPSTGNYCRGGAYDSALLACESIAILPEEMSQERFDWLNTVAGEIIKTPGSESNVKEIFDKVWELRKTRDNISVFNQFDEFGNYLWHYDITGHAMEEVLEKELQSGKFRGVTLTTGSAGTIGCGDYLKEKYPSMKIAAGEALQCPTMLVDGYGAHGIEGIGDKHIPWIHNVKNTDMVIAIDDNDTKRIMRLFNEKEGQLYLKETGVSEHIVDKLPLLGISSIANLLMAIKFAKYYELTSSDVILTVFTDSMELYQSRLKEMNSEFGSYKRDDAIKDFHTNLQGQKIDNMLELDYYGRKRIHNLKYFTWIEQQGKDLDELNRQWYDPNYWKSIQSLIQPIDELIDAFNKKVGLL